MNKQELRGLLKKEGFREDSYYLDGGLPPECYVLAKENNTWAVYYSEHGLQSGKLVFETESEACENILARMRKDFSTKQ